MFRPFVWAVILSVAGAFVVAERSFATSSPAPGPVNVIFDTDMWSDIDDALALAMVHALHARNEINLVAVTISTDDQSCATYVDLVNTFYGHPRIPIGMVRDGIDAEAFREKTSGTITLTAYTELLSEKRKADGSLLYPRRLDEKKQLPEAVSLLRQALAAQPDGTVVLIQVGFSTNFARLLDSQPDASSPLSGRDLVKKKVSLLSVMAGNFQATENEGKTIGPGIAEFNLMMDAPSAQRLFADWPTPIVVSGFEVGMAMPYPVASIERDYSYVEHHPIADAYRTYALDITSEKDGKPSKFVIAWPYDRPTFDLTSVLYAARPDRNYFTLSAPGKITVLPDGASRFEESAAGLHRYLMFTEEQKARALEAMVMLSSQPPAISSTAH